MPDNPDLKDLDQIKARTDALRQSTSAITNDLGTAATKVASAFDVGNTAAENMAMQLQLMQQILESINSASTMFSSTLKNNTEEQKRQIKHVEKYEDIKQTLTKREDKILKQMVKQNQEAKKRIKLEDELISKEKLKEEARSKTADKVSGKLKDWGRQTASFSQSVTGVQLSLGGILALLLRVYNLGNRMSGFGKLAAAQFSVAERGVKKYSSSISGAQKAAWKLRSRFYLQPEEAGAFLGSAAQFGITGKELNANAKYISQQKQQVSFAEELFALNKVLGVPLESSGNLIKSMTRGFDMSNDSAREALASVSTLALQMKGAKESGLEKMFKGMDISLGELISDWNTLIQQAGTYKVDVMGIQGLYNTLLRTDMKDTPLFGGIPDSVKKDIVGTAASFNSEMSDGMKAFFGEGESPVDRLFEFEELGTKAGGGPAAQLARVLGKTRGLVATELDEGDTKTARYKARKFLEGAGFTKEATKFISDNLAKTKDIDSALKDFADKYAVTQAQAEARSAENITKLVKSATSIAASTKSLEEKLKQDIENWILGLKEAINNLIKAIRDLINSIPGFATKGEEQAEARKREEKYISNVTRAVSERKGVSASDISKHEGAMEEAVLADLSAKTKGMDWEDRMTAESVIQAGGFAQARKNISSMLKYQTGDVAAASRRKLHRVRMMHLRMKEGTADYVKYMQENENIEQQAALKNVARRVADKTMVELKGKPSSGASPTQSTSTMMMVP